MLYNVVEIETQATDMADYGSVLDDDAAFGSHGSLADELLGAELQKTFSDSLLTALATMAVRSKRRQADLSAALRRSGLDADPIRVTEALDHLQSVGCIEQLVPLYDGGVLMSVTSRGIEHLNSAPRWTILGSSGFNRG